MYKFTIKNERSYVYSYLNMSIYIKQEEVTGLSCVGGAFEFLPFLNEKMGESNWRKV